MASSKFIFRKIISFLGTKIKNPLVGFGVVGIKTLVKLSLIFVDIGFVVSLVANPTAQAPGFGNSMRTTFLFEDPSSWKLFVNCVTPE